jgi:hypothetical protein
MRINITVTIESIIQGSSQGLWYANFTQSGESRLNNFNYGLNLIQFKFRFLDNTPPPPFSSPDPKCHVSYCHHLACVIVVRRKLFQKSSPLKVLDQWKPNLVWISARVSSFKIVSGDAVHQPTWLLLLKIEHMVKLQVLGNNSKTVNNIKKSDMG